MKQKLQFSITKEILKELKGTSAHERLLHRLHAVALVIGGSLSASEVARIYGDSPRAVAYWVTSFKEKGTEGLLEGVRSGRPSKLNASQTESMQTFVRESVEAGRSMNAVVLCSYVKNTFGVTLTVSQCWRILKKLNA